MASEVGDQLAFDAVLGLDHLLGNLQIRLDVGAAKGIDGLLRISHHKDLSRSELDLAPVCGPLAKLFGQIDEDLILDRIGVLELVDEDRLEAVLQFLTDDGIIAYESSRARQQTVEGDHPLLSKALAKVLRERDEQIAQAATQGFVHLAQGSGNTHDLLSLLNIFFPPSLELFVDVS